MCNFLLFPPFLYSIVFTRVSWRKVDISSLLKREENEQEEGMVGLLFYIHFKLAVGNKKWRSNGRVLRNDGLFLSQSEAIEDEDFLQRHQNYERREKLRRSCWDQDRRHRIRSVYSLVYCKAVLLHIYFSVHIFCFPPRHRSSRKSCSSVSVRDRPAHGHPPVHSPVPFTRTFSTSEDSSEASVVEKEVKLA